MKSVNLHLAIQGLFMVKPLIHRTYNKGRNVVDNSQALAYFVKKGTYDTFRYITREVRLP